jgi:hypothetical protein
MELEREGFEQRCRAHLEAERRWASKVTAAAEEVEKAKSENNSSKV